MDGFFDSPRRAGKAKEPILMSVIRSITVQLPPELTLHPYAFEIHEA
jgi:hypothetical protein